MLDLLGFLSTFEPLQQSRNGLGRVGATYGACRRSPLGKADNDEQEDNNDERGGEGRGGAATASASLVLGCVGAIGCPCCRRDGCFYHGASVARKITNSELGLHRRTGPFVGRPDKPGLRYLLSSRLGFKS